MDVEKEERIRRKVIARAIKEACLRQQQREAVLCSQDLLGALQELTDLPRMELEKIANRATLSYNQEEDEFFSIKQQVVLASAAVLICLCVPMLAVWLF